MFALQTWLAETPEQRKIATTPGYFSVGMACKFPKPLSLDNYKAADVLYEVVMAVVVVGYFNSYEMLGVLTTPDISPPVPSTSARKEPYQHPDTCCSASFLKWAKTTDSTCRQWPVLLYPMYN